MIIIREIAINDAFQTPSNHIPTTNENTQPFKCINYGQTIYDSASVLYSTNGVLFSVHSAVVTAKNERQQGASAAALGKNQTDYTSL